MKISEILSSMQVGDIVSDKRVLSVLKRKGLIYDYDYGYLIPVTLYQGENEYRGNRDRRYMFPKGNAPKWSECEYGIRKKIADDVDIMETYGHPWSEIEYAGCKFHTKYLDGCFNAYLQLVEKCGDREQVKHPRMSVYGVVV